MNLEKRTDTFTQPSLSISTVIYKLLYIHIDNYLSLYSMQYALTHSSPTIYDASIVLRTIARD